MTVELFFYFDEDEGTISYDCYCYIRVLNLWYRLDERRENKVTYWEENFEISNYN